MLNRLEKAATQLQAGNNDALKIIYEATCSGIFAFIFPIVKDYQIAENVMQNTYIQVYEKINLYKPGTNFQNWILTIAKNLALLELKRLKRDILVDNESIIETVGGYSFDKSLSTPTIELASKILKEDDFRIVLLYAVGEYKHREIAKIMNLPLGTVTWKYNNAIKKLKKALKSKGVTNYE